MKMGKNSPTANLMTLHLRFLNCYEQTDGHGEHNRTHVCRFFFRMFRNDSPIVDIYFVLGSEAELCKTSSLIVARNF
jgi:hypothetical protein